MLKDVKESYLLSGKKHVDSFTKINKSDVVKLDEPLKALAAYYSCLASTDFEDDGNNLTDVLNLGSQGSNEHKTIIKKWFNNDSLANLFISRDCFQSSTSSSQFKVFRYLNFIVKGNIVIINYEISSYDHGKSSTSKFINKATIKDNEIMMLISPNLE